MAGSDKTSLGDRMKLYEAASCSQLPPRLPIIIRVDGRAFHSLLAKAKKPYDYDVKAAMDATAIALCEEIQGAQLAYIQSDEISVLVHGYKKLTSQSWFDRDLQKMVSISAAVASVTFSSANKLGEPRWIVPDGTVVTQHDCDLGYIIRYTGKPPECMPLPKPAQFDSRAFVVPEADVCNYFIWRQKDCTRNSIQSLARAHFSHAECNGKNGSQLQDMLMLQKQINWNDQLSWFKRGRCVVKATRQMDERTVRSEWVIDDTIPLFTADRAYIERHLALEQG